MAPCAPVSGKVARREAFLALVRKHGRIPLLDLAAPLGVSYTTVRLLADLLEREGKVVTALDASAKRVPRSTAPRVIWIAGAAPRRIGKRPTPQPYLVRSVALSAAWPYAHTGTRPALAGGVQVIAVAGRAA